MQSFIEYEEYELYDSWTQVDPVSTRDLRVLNTIFEGSPRNFQLPHAFTLFDAEVDDKGCPGQVRHNEEHYVRADSIMDLSRFKEHHEPIVAAEKQNLTTRLGRFSETFLDGGFCLRAAFRAALGPAKPVRALYIQRVETLIHQCDERGITHVAVSNDGFEHGNAAAVLPGLKVFNKNMMIINP